MVTYIVTGCLYERTWDRVDRYSKLQGCNRVHSASEAFEERMTLIEVHQRRHRYILRLRPFPVIGCATCLRSRLLILFMAISRRDGPRKATAPTTKLFHSFHMNHLHQIYPSFVVYTHGVTHNDALHCSKSAWRPLFRTFPGTSLVDYGHFKAMHCGILNSQPQTIALSRFFV